MNLAKDSQDVFGIKALSELGAREDSSNKDSIISRLNYSNLKL